MRGADAALDHAPFAIDEFEFGETQQEADMIETFACRLCGDFFIFSQEGRQFELPQMMGEQNLRRRRAGKQEPPPSCCSPGNENHIIGGRGCLDVRGGQIGIVAEIEVCGSVFDLGDDELLDRIEADRAEPIASSAAAATSVSGKTSISRNA